MRSLLVAGVVLGIAGLSGTWGCRSNPPAASPAPAAPTPLPPPTALPAAAAGTVPPPPAGATTNLGKIEMAVTEEGFEPDRIAARKGQPITLAITRKTDKTCARDIVFQGQAGKTALPLGKTVEVMYTPKASGQIKFGCAMGMMVSGVLSVSD
jgi:Cupredoxin-like domain